jgi:hypothetical protein
MSASSQSSASRGRGSARHGQDIPPLNEDQRERYMTLRIVEIWKDGIVGDTFTGPIGAIEVFNQNRDCDVTIVDPRRVPWWHKPPNVERSKSKVKTNSR